MERQIVEFEASGNVQKILREALDDKTAERKKTENWWSSPSPFPLLTKEN